MCEHKTFPQFKNSIQVCISEKYGKCGRELKPYYSVEDQVQGTWKHSWEISTEEDSRVTTEPLWSL